MAQDEKQNSAAGELAPEESGLGGSAQAESPEPSAAEPTPTRESDVVPEPAAPARPAPQYGEYAPEGWEWKPEEEAEASTTAPTGTAAPARGPASPTIPGVPHNLGAGSALPGRAAKSGRSDRTAGAPYVAGQENPQRQQPQQPPQHPGPQPENSQSNLAAPYRQTAAGGSARATQEKPQRQADKIITILLLSIGAIGALWSALIMFNMGMTFAMMGQTPGLPTFTGPDWLSTTGKVVGVAFLAFYALMLVYSVRRMRAGKITFWVPLVAGVVVSLVVFIVVIVAMMSTPELVQIASDPQLSAEMLKQLQGDV